MMLIISRFSLAVPSFVRQSYRDWESVTSIMGIGSAVHRKSSIVDLIEILILKPSPIAYSSPANTLLVTLLLFTNF